MYQHPDLKFFGTLIHTKPKKGLVNEAVVPPPRLFSRGSILGDNLPSSEADGGVMALDRDVCAHRMYTMQINMRTSISENQACQDEIPQTREWPHPVMYKYLMYLRTWLQMPAVDLP